MCPFEKGAYPQKLVRWAKPILQLILQAHPKGQVDEVFARKPFVQTAN